MCYFSNEMKPPNRKQAAPRIAELAAELLGGSAGFCVRQVGPAESYDVAITAGEQRFLAKYQASSSAGLLASAIDHLQRESSKQAPAELPLLIVPYMGEAGRQLCESSHISWFDLCGNAKIVAPGLRIWIEGRSNAFIARGRPANLFAAKSSRIVRLLLLDPDRFHSQAELARTAELGDGYVSKIVGRLRQERYVETNAAGAVRPLAPDQLLAAWQDAYDFGRHRLVQGHVPARSGEELLQRVVQTLAKSQADWAVTGLGAAWLYTGYAAFRLATVYVSSLLPATLLSELEFSHEPAGANLWLALPDDDGVFHGSQVREGIRCVSPVQTYLDLQDQPERAQDAAARLRQEQLAWARHGT